MHTQGEWKVKKKGRNDSGIYAASIFSYAANNKSTIVGHLFGKTQEEATANAELICKAVNAINNAKTPQP